tara:strand:+ start:203 stop:394 length:192 start_codon:yes stop_codon:yes gene_type:complete
MYTILNEVDLRIYDGTPVFETVSDAVDWWRKNSERPSDIIVSLESMGSVKDINESTQEFLEEQ